MSETIDQKIASHTLSFLRRLDRRQDEFVDPLTRQTELIMRLKREMREGFEILGKRFDHVERDLREMRNDVVLIENRILNRMNAELDLSRRLERVESELSVEANESASTNDF